LVGAQVRWDKEITEPVKNTFFFYKEEQIFNEGKDRLKTVFSLSCLKDGRSPDIPIV
jgi:hypothetical protein